MSDAADETKAAESEKPKLIVNDRRHWAANEDGNEANAAPTEKLPTYVEKLKLEAEEKDRRLREYIAAYKAKTTETEEFKQRLQRDNESKLDLFKVKLFAALTPILDNLKRAASADSNAAGVESLRRGIQLVADQFSRKLEEYEVIPIPAAGRKFNPVTDEACITVETANPEQDGLILEELEAGYTYRGKLVKPAKVKVARCQQAQ